MLDEWAERIAALRDRFADELISRGFRLDGASPDHYFLGAVALSPSQGQTTIRIGLPDGWPYRQTKIWPVDWNRPLSWHQEADGALCLFPESSPGLPWTNTDRLLEKATQWFAQSAADWPDDEPDLDLERYFDSVASHELLVYGDVDALIGRLFRVAKGRGGRYVEPRRSGKKSPKGARFGSALDLGELASPVRTWEEVLVKAGDSGLHAESLVKRVGSAVILLKYQRGPHAGVLALRADHVDGEVHLASIESSSNSEETRRLRAGYDADDLARFMAVIVGMGAIGSTLADQLSRSGIGKLRLVDNQTLRPGNSIRHLVGQEAVGKHKSSAVADHIRAAGHSPLRGIETVDCSVRSPEQAAQVFQSADLVVDATGSPTTTSLLASAAECLQQRLLALYLQRDGDVGRVERFPRSSAENPLPPVTREPQGHRVLRESGCGDPVSPASPSAALIVAGLGSLAAADVLLDRPVPPSMTHVLRPQIDKPYRVRTVLQ